MNQESSGLFDHGEGDGSPLLDDQPVSAPVSTAVIAGKTFVSGLFWQPLSKPRSYKKEAQEIGKREGMDVVAIRTGRIFQAGFAPKGEGATKGMYSLAAALSAKLGPSWIGAFALPDGRFAFCAVNEGTIVPGCDMIGGREDIEQRLRSFFSSVSSWDRVYAPSNFEFGGEELKLEELLAPDAFSRGAWAQHQLFSLTFGLGRDDFIKIGVGVALLIAAYFGLTQYQSYKIRVAREAAIRAEIARKAEEDRMKAAAKAGSQIDIDRPWGKMPSVEAFLVNCTQQFNQMPLSIGGWIFGESTCSSSSIQVKYLRQTMSGAHSPATTKSFLQEFSAGAFATASPVFNQDQTEATIDVALKMDLRNGEEILGSAQALAAYGSIFQQHDLTVAFNTHKDVVAPALPGAPTSAPAGASAAAVWSAYDFGFDTKEAPVQIFAGNSWTGLRLNTVIVTLDKNSAELKWNVTGKLYAK